MSKVREKRDEEIFGMYKDRYTLAEIGERFNITRQRVHQIIKKRLSTGGSITA